MNISFLTISKTKILSVLLIVFAMVSFCHIVNAAPSVNPSSFKDYYKIAPKDKSKEMIESIFGKITSKTLKEKPQTIIAAMFKDFNHAILVLAIIVIIYTLLLSLISTAGSGQFIIAGKKASMWLPLRTVGGIALILPTPSGYSIIQVFFMWVIMQGIGAADSLWNATINYLQNPTSTSMIAPVKPYMGEEKQLMMNILASSICRQRALRTFYILRYNQYNNQPSAGFPKPDKATDYTNKAEVPPKGKTYNKSWTEYNYDVTGNIYSLPAIAHVIPKPASKRGKHWYDAFSPSSYYWSRTAEKVGSVIIPCGKLAIHKSDTPSNLSDEDKIKYRIINNQMPEILNTINGAAKDYVKAEDDKNNIVCNGKWKGSKNNRHCTDVNIAKTQEKIIEAKFAATTEGKSSIVGMAAKSLHNALQTEANEYLKSHKKEINKEVFKDAKKFGWIYAGGYYYSIARLNNRLSKIIQLDKSAIQQPDRQSLLGAKFEFYTLSDNAFLTDLLMLDEGNVPQIGPRFTFGETPIASQQAKSITALVNDTLNSIIPSISAILTGQSDPTDPISGYFSDPDVNPLIKLQALGNNMTYGIIKLIFGIWISYIGIYLMIAPLGFVPFFGGISVFLTSLLRFIFSTIILPALGLLVGLLGTAFMMSTYMPLVPFLIFTFTAIGWLLATIETMLAAPIVALGLTHPEGSETLGRADTAVQLILNMFLRPSLMIFGLISAMVVSEVAVNFFTGIYSYVVGNIVSTTASGANVIQVVLYLVIYVGTVITILNKSFDLIHQFPDRILGWIGWQQQFGHYKGDEDKVENQFFKGVAGAPTGIAGAQFKKASELKPDSVGWGKGLKGAGKILKPNLPGKKSKVGENPENQIG